MATQFSDHDWVSAPVVDENNILLGRITIDDVVDIIRDQAEHQALGAAGLDEDEDLFRPVPRATRRRALWLGINLLTAFLASWVIGHFEATLQQVVALAVLMPIVASMGGVAGTQMLTLMVRGLALGQVGIGNLRALLLKEVAVGVLNGMLSGRWWWASVAWLWFGDPRIALVIAAGDRDQPGRRGAGRRAGAADAQAHEHRSGAGRRRGADHRHRSWGSWPSSAWAPCCCSDFHHRCCPCRSAPGRDRGAKGRAGFHGNRGRAQFRGRAQVRSYRGRSVEMRDRPQFASRSVSPCPARRA